MQYCISACPTSSLTHPQQESFLPFTHAGSGHVSTKRRLLSDRHITPLPPSHARERKQPSRAAKKTKNAWKNKKKMQQFRVLLSLPRLSQMRHSLRLPAPFAPSMVRSASGHSSKSRSNAQACTHLRYSASSNASDGDLRRSAQDTRHANAECQTRRFQDFSVAVARDVKVLCSPADRTASQQTPSTPPPATATKATASARLKQDHHQQRRK